MNGENTASVSDDDLARLLAAFGRLSEFAHEYATRERDTSAPSLVAALEAHLGTDPGQLPVVADDISLFRVADFDVALEKLVDECGGGELIGVGGGDQRWHQTLTEMISGAYGYRVPLGPVDYRSMSVGPDEERAVIAFGVRLFEFEHAGQRHPVAVLVRASRPQHGPPPKFEVLTAGDGVAAALIARLHELANEHSVLRGKVVMFTGSEYGSAQSGVTFVERPTVATSAVVLPDGTLSRIRRHVLGIAEHRQALRDAGQHLKRGVLLFGPPGTGKTHTVRHLIGEATDATVIVLSGQSLRFVGLAAETARALQPAIVVLEDCDLVAHERSMHSESPLLFEVLDALDGLASDSDVVFLLTTNRADVLEPALAQRPGRVDLAVEVPKPDASARLALLRLYADDLGFSEEVLTQVAEAGEGTTASFVKELVRRAVLSAAETGEPVADAHLRAASEEMLRDTSAINLALLGSPGV